MPRRSDLYSFSPQERSTLANLILSFLNDAVVRNHTTITHSDIHLFTGHRSYIESLERFLIDRGANQFVPLPKWNPATPIPGEFNVVKPDNGGRARPSLQNLNPNRSMPSQFASPAVCSYTDGNALGNAANPWHGEVHGAVGGTMADFETAPAAPIFWCWHAFVDEIYYDWERCPLLIAGDPMGYMSNAARVVYRGQDGHLHELAIYPETGAWGDFDMTDGASP
jgi:Common central domain of tyrosinase